MFETVCLAAEPVVYQNVSALYVQMQNPVNLFLIQISAVIVGGLITLLISTQQQKKSFEKQEEQRKKSFDAQIELQKKSFEEQSKLQKENIISEHDHQMKLLKLQDERDLKIRRLDAYLDLLRLIGTMELSRIEPYELGCRLIKAGIFGDKDVMKNVTTLIKESSTATHDEQDRILKEITDLIMDDMGQYMQKDEAAQSYSK